MRYEIHGSGPHLSVGYPLRASGKGADDNPAAAVRDGYAMRTQSLMARHVVRMVDGNTLWLVTIPGNSQEITVQHAVAKTA